MDEGKNQGHAEKYYQTLDQRFLGDEEFINEIAARTGAKEVEARAKKVVFENLLKAVTVTHDVDRKALLQAGRQRQWVAVRAQLVYLAREWCGENDQGVRATVASRRVDNQPLVWLVSGASG